MSSSSSDSYFSKVPPISLAPSIVASEPGSESRSPASLSISKTLLQHEQDYSSAQSGFPGFSQSNRIVLPADNNSRKNSVAVNSADRMYPIPSIPSFSLANEAMLLSSPSLLPHLSHHKFRSPSLPANSLMAPSIQLPSSLNAISSNELQNLLNNNNNKDNSSQFSTNNKGSNTLIIDVRPFTQYSKSRIKSAINICIPSTLLKRPTFTIARFGECMIPYQRNCIEHLDQYDHVVVYDQSTDEVSTTCYSPLAYTILKLSKAESFKGSLSFLSGGISSFTASHAYLVNEDLVGMSVLGSTSETPKSSNLSVSSIQAGNKSAKANPSNLSLNPDSVNNDSSKRLKSSQTFNFPPVLTGFSLPLSSIKDGPMKPFASNLRNNTLDHFDDDCSPLDLPAEISSQEIDNYFPLWLRDLIDPEVGPQKIARRFHDIEQAEKVRLQTAFSQAVKHPVPSTTTSSFGVANNSYKNDICFSSNNKSSLNPANPLATQATANQAPCINTGVETLSNHSQTNDSRSVNNSATLVNGTSIEKATPTNRDYLDLPNGGSITSDDCCEPITPDDTQIKYSFSAGVELGAKNRYNNIWPYDHTRVRLSDKSPEGFPSSIDKRHENGLLNGGDENCNELKSDSADSAKTVILGSSSETKTELGINNKYQVGHETNHLEQLNLSDSVNCRFNSKSQTGFFTSSSSASPKHQGNIAGSTASSPKSTAPCASKSTLKLPSQSPFSFVSSAASVIVPEASKSSSNAFLRSPCSVSGSGSVPSSTTSTTTPSTANTTLPTSAVSTTFASKSKDDNASDYFNASYISPKGSNNRYIATQGPLPDTFADFWHVVWDKKIPLIVMLTAETEGGHVKCHTYWNDGVYGKLKLEIIEEKDVILSEKTKNVVTVRKFSLKPVSSGKSAAGRVNADQRKLNTKNGTESAINTTGHTVIQIQYASWPDLGSPASPEDLIGICRLKDQYLTELVPTVKVADKKSGTNKLNAPPFSIHSKNCHNLGFTGTPKPWVLVHCSAGCGRTGTFCTVDSVIDMLREYGMSVVPKSRRFLKTKDAGRPNSTNNTISAPGSIVRTSAPVNISLPSTCSSSSTTTTTAATNAFPIPLSAISSVSAAKMASIFATASNTSSAGVDLNSSSYISIPNNKNASSAANPVSIPSTGPSSSVASSTPALSFPPISFNFNLSSQSGAQDCVPCTPSSASISNPFNDLSLNPLSTSAKPPNVVPLGKPSLVTSTPKPAFNLTAQPEFLTKSFNFPETPKPVEATKSSTMESGKATCSNTSTTTNGFNFSRKPDENSAKTDSNFESYDLVYRTVHDFRRQRLSMVQMLRQYVLCYETIILWIHQRYMKEQEGKQEEKCGLEGNIDKKLDEKQKEGNKDVEEKAINTEVVSEKGLKSYFDQTQKVAQDLEDIRASDDVQENHVDISNVSSTFSKERHIMDTSKDNLDSKFSLLPNSIKTNSDLKSEPNNIASANANSTAAVSVTDLPTSEKPSTCFDDEKGFRSETEEPVDSDLMAPLYKLNSEPIMNSSNTSLNESQIPKGPRAYSNRRYKNGSGYGRRYGNGYRSYGRNENFNNNNCLRNNRQSFQLNNVKPAIKTTANTAVAAAASRNGSSQSSSLPSSASNIPLQPLANIPKGPSHMIRASGSFVSSSPFSYSSSSFSSSSDSKLRSRNNKQSSKARYS